MARSEPGTALVLLSSFTIDPTTVLPTVSAASQTSVSSPFAAAFKASATKPPPTPDDIPGASIASAGISTLPYPIALMSAAAS